MELYGGVACESLRQVERKRGRQERREREENANAQAKA